MKSLMAGMQTHLDNSSPSVRRQGMIIAEAITDVPEKGQEHKLKFEVGLRSEFHYHIYRACVQPMRDVVTM